MRVRAQDPMKPRSRQLIEQLTEAACSWKWECPECKTTVPINTEHPRYVNGIDKPGTKQKMLCRACRKNTNHVIIEADAQHVNPGEKTAALSDLYQFGSPALKWDSMTPEQRLQLIRKDPSMRHPRWKDLACRWAAASWDSLSDLSREASAYLLKLP